MQSPEAESSKGVQNLWKLNFQKLGLELKCSLCLNMLNQPVLLPCDHTFCCVCIPKSVDSVSRCPICCCHYFDKELRRAPQMEDILRIYKSMGAALGFIPFQKAPQDANLTADQNKGRSLNQVAQPSPCSPLSVAQTLHPNDNHSVPQAENSAKRLPTEGTVTKETEVENLKICGRSKPNGEEDHARGTKRQRLEFGLQDMTSDGGIHIQSNNLDSENSLHKLGKPLSGADAPTSYNLDADHAFVCAFCQSSNSSEVYGPILHYKDGKAVEVNKLNQPGVQHVHKRCIDWAPQVYYEGENVKNLEREIARAAGLNCNKCGLKGAALGCVIRSCRKSFHVPCAVFIDQCRWDMENFHMLCPTHRSQKFPSERSKSKKRVENHSSITEIASPQPKTDGTASTGTAKEWIICGSDLSTSSEVLLLKFAKITGATVSKVWNTNVTHVIAATDEKGAFRRTLKVLMGILNGRWILTIDWVKASVESLNPVNEEAYELNIDIHGCQDGPKRGRLRMIEKAPKLFSGLCFYFCGYFEPHRKHVLRELVEVAGGVILEMDKTSQGCDIEAECSTRLVVYSIDIPAEKKPKDIALLLKQRCEEAEEMAFRTRSWVVHHIWILESIAALKLQPFSC